MNTDKRVALWLFLFVLASAPGSTFSKTESKRQTESTFSQQSAQQSALASLEFLAEAMDQFHNRFPVYDDNSSAGNHFHALAKIPDANARVTNFGSHTGNTHSGATAIRCQFTPGGVNFGGFYYHNGILRSGESAPVPNFGTALNAGINLTGATALTFWARGERGGEIVEVFMGGVGRNSNTGEVMNPCVPGFAGPCPAPDSTPVVKKSFMLTANWQQYSIDLTGKNLAYVLGGFGWVVDGFSNPQGAFFYFDDIQYELSAERRTQRLNEPRFIRSYVTLPVQPNPNDANTDDDIDLVLRNTAFVYDNALAALAFLTDEGSADNLRRARLIGDALVYATEHDRFFSDGRLRSAYGAGDIALPPGWVPNNRAATVPVAGFYVETSQRFDFVELGESSTIDTGNNAWAMIALLALHKRTNEARYLNTARKLGEVIRAFRQASGTYQGFLGGLQINQPETITPPTPRTYASTEHNLDVVAAFTLMLEATNETQWQADATHARQFVESMWESNGGCYLTGTTNPNQRNMSPAQLPVDVQAWAALATPDALTLHPQLLICAETNHRTLHHTFSGFDFNNDRNGVWFEGTGQMAVAYAWAGYPLLADALRQELRRAQQTAPYGNGRGIAAACHDGITTGFDFKLFQRLHVGATAWNAFAQLGFNPYYQTATTLAFGYEADVAPRQTGNGSVTISDWVQTGRYASGLDVPMTGSEFRRADCAPRNVKGDGRLSISDWVQAGRYAAGLDSVAVAGGPTTPAQSTQLLPASKTALTREKTGAVSRTERAMYLTAGVELGTVTIQLDAMGDENAVGGSLSFDPSQWRFVSANVGNDARQAILQVNVRQARNGNLGWALALPAGKTMPAGVNGIVVVRFVPINARRDSRPMIEFADFPVAREAVGDEANPLSLRFAVADAKKLRAAAKK